MRATREPRENLQEILYDPTDVPSPTFVGGFLWVVLFFFPLPLMLLIHWWLHQQPTVSIWLGILNTLTGLDWRTVVIATLTFTGCCSLVYVVLRYFPDPKSVEFIQSVTDGAGLQGWQRQLLWITPLVIVPMTLLRKMGVIELALLGGVEATLLATRKINRFPEETVNLVPVELEMEVERLRRLQGDVVTYNWSFQPEPLQQAESLSMQIAFNPERLEQARQRPLERLTDGDWRRFATADTKNPEIVALAQQLHELCEERFWTPFQKCLNVLEMLATFEVDEYGTTNRYAIETLYEQRGTANDLVIAAFNLLKAMKETVPDVVLVLSGDGTKAGLGIAGVGDLPEKFQGFKHGGRTFLFAYPQQKFSAWKWHIGAVPEGWQPLRVLTGGR